MDVINRFDEGNQWETEFGPAPCGGVIHVIRKGDTLYRLSQVYHVSVADIMYQNPYVDIYNLKIGDELCIPISKDFVK